MTRVLLRGEETQMHVQGEGHVTMKTKAESQDHRGPPANPERVEGGLKQTPAHLQPRLNLGLLPSRTRGG